MSKLEINLGGEDVDRALADAILDSSLGEEVRKQVHEMLKSTHRNSPIADSVRRAIGLHVNKIVAEEFKDEIRSYTKKAIEAIINDDEALEKITDAMADLISNKLNPYT